MATQHHASDHADWKLHAAQRALQLVEPGMAVGLGSGSTATLWIKLLGEQVRDHGLKIRALASSEDSERLGRSYGIPFVSFEGWRRQTVARKDCCERIQTFRGGRRRIETSPNARPVSFTC